MGNILKWVAQALLLHLLLGLLPFYGLLFHMQLQGGSLIRFFSNIARQRTIMPSILNAYEAYQKLLRQDIE